MAAAAIGAVAVGVIGPIQAPQLRAANGADRWDDRAVLSGPVLVEGNKQNMVMTHDAIYYLNYHRGTLLASVPDYKISASGAQVLSQFAERDLVKDFAIKAGASPHFLMTTAGLGLKSEGWAPLIVFETESGQVAVYKLDRQISAGSDAPRLSLVELRRDARLAHRDAPVAAAR
jgi:hypothetical protein